jgi:Family of unknown function (DUF6220)
VTTGLKEPTLRKVFAVLASLLPVLLAAQFFLAAFGAFDTGGKDQAFEPHRSLGYIIIYYAVLLTIVAAVARMPGRLIGMTGLVAVLGVVQSLIGTIADALNGPGDSSTTAGKLIFGLHAINGLAIIGVAVAVAQQARVLSRTPIPRPAGAKAPESAAGPAQPR